MPRGRGRGRGRWIIHRSRSRGGRRNRNFGWWLRCAQMRQESTNGGLQANAAAALDLDVVDVETKPIEFFVDVVSSLEHWEAQEEKRFRYAAVIAVLQKSGVEIAQSSRVRALAMAWARNDYELAGALLKNRSEFGLPEVVKAIQLLDSGRQARVMEKKLKRLQTSGTKASTRKMARMRSRMVKWNLTKPSIGSATAAVCRHVTQWARSFSREELEFHTLDQSKHSWKKLADVCHFHPEKDFTALPWFIPFCFGKDAPEGSIVDQFGELTSENINEVVAEFDIPFSHLKNLKEYLTEDSKKRIAEYEHRLDTVLWYYESLQCKAMDEVIERRLQASPSLTPPSCKVLSRLLTSDVIRDRIRENINYTQGRLGTGAFLPDLLRLVEPRLTSIRFGPVWMKYHEGQGPGDLEFTYYLPPQLVTSHMACELKSSEFCLGKRDPGMCSTLDPLFGVVSSESAMFTQELATMETRMQEEGVAVVFDSLKYALTDQNTTWSDFV